MDSLRELLRLRRLLHLKQRRGSALVAAAGGLALLTVGLVAIVAGPFHQAATVNTPVVSASATASNTSVATLTPRATHTPTKKKPKPATVVNAPPAPPIPTAPSNPTNNFCPTPTPLPVPTATDTPPVPTATASATASTTAGTSSAARSNCQQCPYYKGNNPSQAQIQNALIAAANRYQLPRNLLLAVAWQESRWHEDVISCDGGIGLMQVQYYTYPWLNGQSVPVCGLSATSYDPNTLQGNADLGAKFLKWISCFYSYWGDDGGSSIASPGAYTIAWYYQQVQLQYPDTLNANGSANSNSLCAAAFNDTANSYYAALPSTTSNPWSCPYSATAGDGTLLDFTLSAYNEGPGYTDQNGIQNWWYVEGVEGFIPQFAAGTLP